MTAREEALYEAARATLLWFSGGDWNEEKRLEWKYLTGKDEATSKILCDTVRAAIATEARDLMGISDASWGLMSDPLPDLFITPWSWHQAEDRWLLRYSELVTRAPCVPTTRPPWTWPARSPSATASPPCCSGSSRPSATPAPTSGRRRRRCRLALSTGARGQRRRPSERSSREWQALGRASARGQGLGPLRTATQAWLDRHRRPAPGDVQPMPCRHVAWRARDMTLLWILAAWLSASAVFVLGYAFGVAIGQRRTEEHLRRSGRLWLVRLDDPPPTPTWTAPKGRREWRA